MKETNKIEWAYNLFDEVEQNDAQSIYVTSANILEQALANIMSHDMKLLLNLQEEMSRHRNYLIFQNKANMNSNNALFALGRYDGIIEALYNFLKIMISKERSIEAITTAEAKDIPHINDIISAIFTQQGIRHGILAQKIGVEKNTLTPIMDKLFKAGLVTFSRPGKYKYYYLTEEGEKFYNNNNLKSISNIDYLIEQLLIYTGASNDPYNVLMKIMGALSKGNHVFDGYMVDKEKRINPVSLIPGIIANDVPIDISFTNSNVCFQIDSADIVSFSELVSSKKIIVFNNINQVNHTVLKTIKED